MTTLFVLVLLKCIGPDAPLNVSVPTPRLVKPPPAATLKLPLPALANRAVALSAMKLPPANTLNVPGATAAGKETLPALHSADPARSRLRLRLLVAEPARL